MDVRFEAELGIDKADSKLLLRYYAVAGPLMERIVGGIPFVWSTLPKGLGGPTIYHTSVARGMRATPPQASMIF